MTLEPRDDEAPAERGFGPLDLSYPDRTDWTLAHVMAEQARRHGSRVFLQEGEGRQRAYTYRETYKVAVRLAGGLQRLGAAKGDRIAIMATNRPEYVLAWLGASIGGMIEVPVNTDYEGTYLSHVMNLTEPTVVVTEPRFVDRFVSIASEMPAHVHFVVLGDEEQEPQTGAMHALEQSGFRSSPFDGVVGHASSDEALPQVNPWDLSAIFPTSGTTGPSKGVMMPHAQVILFAELQRNVQQLRKEDVYLCANPLFHGNAQFLMVVPVLLAGATLVLYGKFSAKEFLDRVRKWRCTHTNFVGAMTHWVWTEVRSSPPDPDVSLRCIHAAPTPASVAEDLVRHFGLDALTEAYGQTEIALPFLTPWAAPRPAGAVGKLAYEYFDVQLVNPETYEPVPVGEVGELTIRPRFPWTINVGYWGMPDATAEAHRNVWFRTGDAFYCDHEGWYYFVDRMKDTLRRFGENISSFEVEQSVEQHEGVVECAVVAVPSEFEGGEDEVKAFVVLSPETHLETVAKWSVGALPKFLRPRYWEEIDALPKTPSAKIQKAALRDRPDGDVIDLRNLVQKSA